MNIPNRDECFALMCQMDMLEHIAAHSLLVSWVALLITDHLIDMNMALNRELIAASSVLHDITKTRSFKTGENHAESGQQYLEEKGYPEVGDIVGQHVRLNHYTNGTAPSESEIVNYADKRVLHDKVVSLDERMTYILERYGKIPELRERLEWIGSKTIELEAKLFHQLPFLPDELDQYVDWKKFNTAIVKYKKVCCQ